MKNLGSNADEINNEEISKKVAIRINFAKKIDGVKIPKIVISIDTISI